MKRVLYRLITNSTLLFPLVYSVGILLLFTPYISFSQSQSKLSDQHEQNLHLLEKAKDSLYSTILDNYNASISKDPQNYLLQIERCKFIEKAYYDSYEGSNPNYEKAEKCVDELISSFPGIPEVMLYKSEYLYGDSAKAFYEKILDDFQENPEKWEGKGIWIVYKQMAELEESEENTNEVIRYCELAEAASDTLDMSLILARQYKVLKQYKKAIDCLDKRLYDKQESWILNEKGKLLLELQSPRKALVAFRLAKKDTAAWQDAGLFGKIMIENGLYRDAREYLEKDVSNSYDKTEALTNLLEYDLKYGISDSAYATYQRLVDISFWNDPAGIYRIKLFWKAPLFYWSIYDVLRVGILVLVIAGVILLPYIIILPIHYIGALFKERGMETEYVKFRWELKHFWFACSLYMLACVIVIITFEYDTLFTESTEVVLEVSKVSADYSLLFMVIMLLGTLMILRREDFKNFWGEQWGKRASILKGIGLAFLLKFGWGIVSLIFSKLGWNTGPSMFYSVIDSIISVNQYYHPFIGFLFVVILVPFYEEVLFRGVILSSCQKHMKFFFANTLQAVIFALVHQDLKLFPFYFAFGFLAGIYRRKSESLAPSIAFHATNNLLAFVAILRL